MNKFLFRLKGAGIALHMIVTGVALIIDASFVLTDDPRLDPLLVTLTLLVLMANYGFYHEWRTTD